MKIYLISLSILLIIASAFLTTCSMQSSPVPEDMAGIAGSGSIVYDFEAGVLTGEEAMDKLGSCFEVIRLSGNAFQFPAYQRIEGAEVTILERPWKPAVITDTEGYFEVNILKLKGCTADCSFVFKHPNFPESQTKTFSVADNDIDSITFQVPDNSVFGMLKVQMEAALSAMLGVPYTIDTAHTAQVVTTVTRLGGTIYIPGEHGEAGAVAIMTPAQPFPMIGPIYYNSLVLPDPTLTQTSSDGGVLYINVPVGEYTITAQKQDTSFEIVRMKCRPGVFMNASPPYAVQVTE